MEGTLEAFIDHYIILLAARFSAEKERDGGDRWGCVAGALQHALAGPCPASDRAALRSLDPQAFTAGVCRERARYLLWRARQEGTAGAAETRGYSVLRDSLADEVSAIFAAARARLPTIHLSDSDDDDEDSDGAVPEVQEHTRRTADGATFVRTEAEERRNRDLAREREALLSRVQALQAEFYQRHRRWVDVPEDLLDDTPAAAATRAEEEAERAQLLAALGGRADAGARSSHSGAGADALESLRRAVHVNRPARPSAMSDDAIEQLYASSAIPAVAHRGGTPGRASTAGSAPHTASKETAPPQTRGSRWQIVEYDEDDDGEGNDDDA